MKIKVGNKEIELNKDEVKIADSIANIVINSVKQKADSKKMKSLFYTFILVMHVKTGAIIKETDTDKLKSILTKTGKE